MPLNQSISRTLLQKEPTCSTTEHGTVMDQKQDVAFLTRHRVITEGYVDCLWHEPTMSQSISATQLFQPEQFNQWSQGVQQVYLLPPCTALTLMHCGKAHLAANALHPKHSQRLTLSEQHMAHSSVNVVVNRVPTVDHQAIHKLHGLSPLSSELPRHHHLTALGSALHDEAQHTIAGSVKNKRPICVAADRLYPSQQVNRQQ